VTPAAGSTLSRFTPSLMPPDLLERLFVARERLLESIMQRIEAAAVSTERNHTLLVGPRGAGKTHLVSLAYHRSCRLRENGARLQLSWLPEDPWTVLTYRHLLAAIVGKLEPAIEGAVPRDQRELEALLRQRAADAGPIVVFVENLDQILRNIEKDGQQRLRHLLQADRSLLLVATSTRLDRSLADQASPFYGFFTTTRLEPFDVDEAAAMLAAVAQERGDERLVEYLGTEAGRARLRTITHLAGGQPRMWAALASALTVEGLDDLIDLLLTRFDDLTPYYQEQLARLAPQQRMVVAELAGSDRPMNVKELADRLDIDQRSLGKTMTELVERRWAAPTTSRVVEKLDRRRTYYELAEPLARLSFQIKESRGEPLRLVVEFLKHWFDTSELAGADCESGAAEYVLLASRGHASDPVIAVTRRLRRLPVTRAPAVELLQTIDDAVASLMRGDAEPFMRLPAPVRAALEDRLAASEAADVRVELHEAAQEEFGHTRHPAMAGWIERAEGLLVHTRDKPRAQMLLAGWLGRAWRFEEAIEVLVAASGTQPADQQRMLYARANLAHSFWAAGRTAEAMDIQEVVLVALEEMLGGDHPRTLIARASLASSYAQAGRTHDAIRLEEAVLKVRERDFGDDHPDTLSVRGNLAVSYVDAGHVEEAIEMGKRVVADSTRILGGDHRETLVRRANLAVAVLDAGNAEKAMAMLEDVLLDTERVLGPDHVDTLRARANLAAAMSDAGRYHPALELEQAVVGDRARVLGDDHPDTLLAQSNLAYEYARLGRWQEATDLREAVLEASLRVLGAAHPRTRLAKHNLASSYRAMGREQDARLLEAELQGADA
jgi:tetratricopeptide (TPR) repeat protein